MVRMIPKDWFYDEADRRLKYILVLSGSDPQRAYVQQLLLDFNKDLLYEIDRQLKSIRVLLGSDPQEAYAQLLVIEYMFSNFSWLHFYEFEWKNYFSEVQQLLSDTKLLALNKLSAATRDEIQKKISQKIENKKAEKQRQEQQSVQWVLERQRNEETLKNLKKVIIIVLVIIIFAILSAH